MKFPFFASFIVLCLWVSHQVRKSRKIETQQKKSFWELESEANSTRRKSLENLDYIKLPLEALPFDCLTDNLHVQECLETLRALSEQKIVNFTGQTNTELKLQYGAPNINLLMEYDQNYTLLARTLQQLAEELFRNGLIAEAKTVLTFAVSTKTDVSQSYFLLADIYSREGKPEKIKELITAAESLHSVMKNPIVRTLQEAGPYSGLLRSL